MFASPCLRRDKEVRGGGWGGGEGEGEGNRATGCFDSGYLINMFRSRHISASNLTNFLSYFANVRSHFYFIKPEEHLFLALSLFQTRNVVFFFIFFIIEHLDSCWHNSHIFRSDLLPSNMCPHPCPGPSNVMVLDVLNDFDILFLTIRPSMHSFPKNL